MALRGFWQESCSSESIVKEPRKLIFRVFDKKKKKHGVSKVQLYDKWPQYKQGAVGRSTGLPELAPVPRTKASM